MLPSSQRENAGCLGLSHLCDSFARSSQTEQPAQSAAIVSASVLCLFLTATCCSLKDLVFILSFSVKYGQMREIFHVGYLAAEGPSPESHESPCVPLTCLIKCFLGSPGFISHIHQAKSPLKVLEKGGGWWWRLVSPTLLYTDKSLCYPAFIFFVSGLYCIKKPQVEPS